MKKNLIWSILAAGLIISHSEYSAAQLLTLKGESLGIKNNGLLYVGGGVTNTGGLIDIQGVMKVTGRWDNQPAANPAATNKVFTESSKGEVQLSGGEQSINGAPTSFPTLTLEGTPLAIKTLYTDTEVRNILNLNNAQLDVKGQALYVLNDEEAAITREAGFINTGALDPHHNGSLVRKVEKGKEYLFPMGSVNTSGQVVMRPLKASPQTTTRVAAQFLPYSASLEGYMTDRKDLNLAALNERFFHTAKNLDTPGDIDFNVLYSTADGSNFSALALWDVVTTGKWTLPKRTGVTLINDLVGLDGNTHLAYNSVFRQPGTIFPLALTHDLHMEPGWDLEIPSLFTPNGDDLNESFVIRNLEKYPNNHMTIWNRWGKMIFKGSSFHLDNTTWEAKDLNDGTYFYVLDVDPGPNNELNFQKTGYVTVLKSTQETP